MSLRPLEWQLVGLGWVLTYRAGPFPKEVDCILVDGPPGWAYRGREGALYQVFKFLKVGGIVILDDYGREEEKKAVLNWVCTFPEALEVRTAAIGHGLAIIKKKHQAHPRWASRRMLKVAFTSWLRIARHRARLLLNRIGVR